MAGRSARAGPAGSTTSRATAVRANASRMSALLSRLWGTSLIPGEQQVQRPAAAHMGACRTQVAEHFTVGAPGLLQGVRENAEVVPGALVIDRPGEPGHRAIVPAQPGLLDLA